MKLNYMDRNTVLAGLSRSVGFSMTKVLAILDEFSRSDADFAEVTYDYWEYSSINSAYGAIRASIKRFGYTFRVRMIRGKLYLDKK